MSLQFSAEAKARIDALVRRYPQRQAALLPVLHLAQHEFGSLSLDVQSLVSATLDVPPVVVHEVVTFYEMYHQQREAQFHLEVCTNISCHLAGADALVDHCKKRLGIEVGHQTQDGVFGLMEAECLASCGSGPMMRVGFDYYEHLTPEALDRLLEQLRQLAPSLHGKGYEMGPGGPHVGPVQGFEPGAYGAKPAKASVPAAAPAPAPAPAAAPAASVPPPKTSVSAPAPAPAPAPAASVPPPKTSVPAPAPAPSVPPPKTSVSAPVPAPAPAAAPVASVPPPKTSVSAPAPAPAPAPAASVPPPKTSAPAPAPLPSPVPKAPMSIPPPAAGAPPSVPPAHASKPSAPPAEKGETKPASGDGNVDLPSFPGSALGKKDAT
ncbi:MAG: NAD(P)H-dependent oxidoreductase subunit E [Deltaproteobacteria bacterium]|nr:NAD(P)H-dependent oxidoreductase subunit E [Deltaproteobacteria bacterium]